MEAKVESADQILIVLFLEMVAAGEGGHQVIALGQTACIDREDTAVPGTPVVDAAGGGAVPVLCQQRAFEEQLAAGAAAQALAATQFKLLSHMPAA